MHIEVQLGHDDIVKLLRNFMPVRIHLGRPDDDKWLYLEQPHIIQLVPDRGLRVACEGRVRWPVPLISGPIRLNSIHVMLRPHVVERDEQEVVFFELDLEDADTSMVPGFIDRELVRRINRELDARQIGLMWNFIRTLSKSFPLPERLEPVQSIELQASSARCRITADHMALAVSLSAHVRR